MKQYRNSKKTMEAETIINKNGASPKSQMSRGNLLSILAIILFTIVSCSESPKIEGCYNYKHSFSSMTISMTEDIEYCFSSNGTVNITNKTTMSNADFGNSTKTGKYKVVEVEKKPLGLSFEKVIYKVKIEYEIDGVKEFYFLKFEPKHSRIESKTALKNPPYYENEY